MNSDRSGPALPGPAVGDSVVSMLRVRDGRTRRLTEIPAAGRRGLLRLCVHPADGGPQGRLAGLRALLVGDVLRRLLEAQGVQVVHTLVVPGRPEPVLARAMAGLGIHPPTDEAAVDDGRADVHVVVGKRRSADGGLWMEVGDTLGVPSAPAAEEADPLAVRLALLGTPYGEPVVLGESELADAGRMLSAWRGHVAAWAHSPSRPVPGDARDEADAALAEDLDTPGVLKVLRRVEAVATVPDGAKFETFAFLDRILGLELTREVGRD